MRLTADLVEDDAACPAVAGLETGNIPFLIATEDDLRYRQRSGEGVSVGMRQRDRSEATVVDDELSVFNAQVIEGLEFLAEESAREAVEVH